MQILYKHRGLRSARPIALLFAVLSMLSYFSSSAKAAPANTWNEFFVTMYDCMLAPISPYNSEMTLRMAFRPDGSLQDKPQITYAKLLGNADEKIRFKNEVFASVYRCVPLNTTALLRRALAGRVFSVRFIARPGS